MKKKHQNIFLFFGLAMLVVMVLQLNYDEVRNALHDAGYWFGAIIVLWAALYVLNTTSWMLIIKAGGKTHIPFWWLYKISVSGFALNYATPGGLMGGEPYRIMALTPLIGRERASSSVILFVMTHIFSHFWFWVLSIVLYVLTQELNTFMAIMLSLTGGFCALCIWFFLAGYRRGLAVRGMKLLGHIPGIKHWARRFIEGHREQLDNIDRQVAALHNQNPRTFLTVVLLELACRVCSALEVMFILLVLYPSVNYIDCILIIAFTTLFANMLFFMPLQLGGREGGFLMSVSGLGLTATAGIFVALLVRIRELIWTAIGLLLIKLDRTSLREKPPCP